MDRTGLTLTALHHGLLACATTCLGIVFVSAGLHAQEAAPVECNFATSITIESFSFDPLVDGPLTYEWQDERGLVVGLEEALVVTLPVGRYTRTLTVTAPGGRSAQDSVTLSVRDTFPPTLQTRSLFFLTPAVAALTGPGLISEMGVTARDQCDPDPTISADPAGPFAAGETEVVLTATDIAGNIDPVPVRVLVAASASAPLPEPREPSTPEPGVPPTPEPRVPPRPRPPPSVAGADQGPVEPPPSVPVPAAGGGYAWWVAGLSGLALAGLFVLALRRRKAVPRPVFQAIARPGAGAQHRILPDGALLLRYEIGLRPTADLGEHTIEEAASRNV